MRAQGVRTNRIDAKKGHIVVNAKGTPTLEMVAAHAGVSRATVSRVVNNSPSVDPRLAELVRHSIAEFGYVPNRAARALARSKTHSIALIVPEDVTRFFGDVYFAEIVAGINDRLERSDYVLALFVATQQPEAKTVRFLAGGGVDGAIVVSHHADDSFVGQVARAMPVVVGGRPSDDVAQVSYVVDVDNVAAAKTGTQHLIDTGRRSIGHISGPLDMRSSQDRTTGWAQALAEAGLDRGPTVPGEFTSLGGRNAMASLLDGDVPIDSVFVASDLMALGALIELERRGVRVPDDIALVGFDDSPIATTTSPQLTTVRQPAREMGQFMADTLVALLEDGGPRQRYVELPTELIIRGSA